MPLLTTSHTPSHAVTTAADSGRIPRILAKHAAKTASAFSTTSCGIDALGQSASRLWLWESGVRTPSLTPAFPPRECGVDYLSAQSGLMGRSFCTPLPSPCAITPGVLTAPVSYDSCNGAARQKTILRIWRSATAAPQRGIVGLERRESAFFVDNSPFPAIMHGQRGFL